MTPEAWQRLSALFAAQHAKTRTTLKKFCEEQGINYGTAKKYISVRKATGRNEMKPAAATLTTRTPARGERKSKAGKKSPAKKQPEISRPGRRKKGEKIAEDFNISEREFLFARLVAQGFAKYQAFLDAGFTWKGKDKPYRESSRIGRKPRVRRAIFYHKEQIQQRYTLEFDEVVAQLVAIVRADPNDLTQYRRVNCRHCFGKKHAYQWRDERELLLAQAEAKTKEEPAPDASGGFGFVESNDPHPECPCCNGEGEGRMYSADTRDIEGDARYLLEGVTMTQLGPAIRMASKMEARRELARLHALTTSPTESAETLALRVEILREELRKKRAEADRIEAENALARKGTTKQGNPTYVIQLVNSPDAEDDEHEGEETNGQSAE